MHYTKLIRTTTQTTQQPQASDSSAEDKFDKILEHLKNVQIPQALKESVLNDYEVNILLEEIMRIEQTYFKDIPKSKKLCKLFVFNVPKNVITGITYLRNHPEIPDILNPVMLLYPFLTDEPADVIGQYLSILMPLIDGSREAIYADAKAYIEYKNEEEENSGNTTETE